MSTKHLKVLAHRFFEECNKGKAAAIAVMDEFYAPDVIVHSGAGEEIHGLRDYKRYMSELFSAFPDAHWTIDDQILEGNKKAARLTMTGTHKSELMGIIPPTRR
jgi:predicted ester cyclase